MNKQDIWVELIKKKSELLKNFSDKLEKCRKMEIEKLIVRSLKNY